MSEMNEGYEEDLKHFETNIDKINSAFYKSREANKLSDELKESKLHEISFELKSKYAYKAYDDSFKDGMPAGKSKKRYEIASKAIQDVENRRPKPWGSHDPNDKIEIFKKPKLKEEAPANCAGGGAIASIGVGPDGEPPAKKSKIFKRRMKTFREFLEKGESNETLG